MKPSNKPLARLNSLPLSPTAPTQPALTHSTCLPPTLPKTPLGTSSRPPTLLGGRVSGRPGIFWTGDWVGVPLSGVQQSALKDPKISAQEAQTSLSRGQKSALKGPKLRFQGAKISAQGSKTSAQERLLSIILVTGEDSLPG